MRFSLTMSSQSLEIVPNLSTYKDPPSEGVANGGDPSSHPILRRTKCPLRTAAKSTASLAAVAALPSKTAATHWNPIVAFQYNQVPPRFDMNKLEAMPPVNDNLTPRSERTGAYSRRAFLVNAVTLSSASAALVAMPFPTEASIQSDLDFLRSLGRRKGVTADDDSSKDTSSSSDSDNSSSSGEDSHSSEEDSDVTSLSIDDSFTS